jgi:16S rRNA (uracil1498-N3)-methyltransferase
VADRFYCPDPVVDGRLTLTGEEAHHLARVRRVKSGDVVEVFDGRGSAWRAEVQAIQRDRADLVVLGGPLPDRSASCPLTLAAAIPKGDRCDWLVEKATELGIDRLVPLVTERSVVDPRSGKLDRLRRVIVEASKQCGRNRLMVLEPSAPWADYLSEETASTRLVAHPGGRPPSSWAPTALGERVALAVGPEGGFTDVEIAAARDAGWQDVSLGPTLLRIETAGLVGCSMILARVGETRA